jgi:hypothetical protein
LVFIGPEAPLANGVVDALEAAGIKAIGPTKQMAQVFSWYRFQIILALLIFRWNRSKLARALQEISWPRTKSPVRLHFALYVRVEWDRAELPSENTQDEGKSEAEGRTKKIGSERTRE